MPPNRIRLAFIGCGRNAGGHGKRMAGIDAVDIVGLCDPSDKALKQFRTHVGGLDNTPSFEHHVDLLKAAPIDAVVISTPHMQHCDQIVDSLGCGAHVLCEKPLVLTCAEAHQVLEAEQHARRHVMISYQRHLIGPYVYARDALASGTLGHVRFVTCRVSQNWIQLKDQIPTPWRLKPKLSGGGQLTDTGSHMLDCMLWLTDLSVDQVHAYQDNCGLDVDVQTAASCRFTTGALGTIAVLGDARGEGFTVYDDINIFAERGELLVANNRVSRRNGDTDLKPVSPACYPATVSPDQAFIELIAGQRKNNPAPSRYGKAMAQLAEGIYRSTQLGRPVKISELRSEQ